MGDSFDERPDELRNPRADRVRRVSRLSGRSARSRLGRHLVEGPQAVREALRWAPGQVEEIYLAPTAARRDPELAEAVTRHRWWPATPEVVAAMSPDAQGVLAVLTTADPATLDEVPAPRLAVLLAEVSDPGNAGTAIRVADAAGAEAVVFGSGSVEHLSPKVIRASAGSVFHLPVIPGVEIADAVARLRSAGCQVLAADARGEWDLDDLADLAAHRRRQAALDPQRRGPGGDAPSGDSTGSRVAGEPGMDAPDLRAPTAWLIGHEARGLTDVQRELADAIVRIPIHGHAESLNLATALAVCLYASARAQRRH